MVLNQEKKLINIIFKKYEIKYYIIKFMYGHSFFLMFKSYRLYFCNKKKNRIFDHFRLYSTLNVTIFLNLPKNCCDKIALYFVVVL